MAIPLIGVPCARDQSTRWHQAPLMAVQESYLSALTGAGGAPLLIPLELPASALERIAGRLDGLLLAGGEDIAPHLYGATPHPKVRNVDQGRDESEIWLSRWALAHDLPLLAICRGLQILNVAAGGTLYQDLPTEWPAGLRHDRYYPAHPRDELAHPVRLAAGSRLRQIFEAGELWVNSRHHQAACRLGEGLAASAWAPDEVIEGLEAPGRRFVVAVQWHPENLLEGAPATRQLFRAFVEAAGA